VIYIAQVEAFFPQLLTLAACRREFIEEEFALGCQARPEQHDYCMDSNGDVPVFFRVRFCFLQKHLVSTMEPCFFCSSSEGVVDPQARKDRIICSAFNG